MTINEERFIEEVAKTSTRRYTARDAENMADDQLIRNYEREEVAEDSKKNILAEMRKRAAKDAAGVIGFAGCAEKFAKYTA